MRQGKCYALILTIGKYDDEKIKDLPSYKMDRELMESALADGLNLEREYMRFLGENGIVKTKSFARAISEFPKLMRKEDMFIFYFSGHGSNGNLCFSDGEIRIQSILNFIEALPVRSKIVLLDCCYSGGFYVPKAKQMSFEETVNTFAGRGIAIFASSAQEEESWLGIGGNHSLYTGILAAAMTTNRRMRRGKVSLAGISEEVRLLMDVWNRKNPNKAQHPIYRASLGGTIYFQVKEYHPYQSLEIYLERDSYTICAVKSLSTVSEKRLAAFVKVKKICSDEELTEISKEVAAQIKNADVFAGENMELRWKGHQAKAIWCYFGYDESDMIYHRYFARSIWVSERKLESKYFKRQQGSVVQNGICLIWDPSYNLLKSLQTSDMSREEFIETSKQLLSKIVSMAEKFIADLEEVENKTTSIQNMYHRYAPWMNEVYREYYKLTEVLLAPNDLYCWMEGILDLAGCVLDLALLLKNHQKFDDKGRWLMKDSIRRYYENLEKLKLLESPILQNE